MQVSPPHGGDAAAGRTPEHRLLQRLEQLGASWLRLEYRPWKTRPVRGDAVGRQDHQPASSCLGQCAQLVERDGVQQAADQQSVDLETGDGGLSTRAPSRTGR